MLKSLKIGFWFLIPLFFISNADIEPMAMANTDLGVFEVHANGVLQKLMNGQVTFETSKGSTSQGTPYSSISLNFMNGGHNQEHVMGFLIKKQFRSKELAIGEYALSKHIKGFINNFDGVFGYADIKALGEEPLFAEKGKLVITQIDADNIRGYLNVRFKDHSNNELFVKGNFHAVNVTH